MYSDSTKMTKISLPKGTILLNRYEITDVLGEGGFSITYVAFDYSMKTDVAIKEYFNRDYMYRDVRISNEIQVLDSDDCIQFQHGLDRFLSESRIISKLSHTHGIVHINDIFKENKTAYLVMDLIDGSSLETILQNGTCYSWDDISRKMLPLIKTLSEIHKKGILHRDIKPGNIIVNKDGSFSLIDFGAALPLTCDETHSVYLSEGYAPKEQYLHKGKLEPSSDIYSLCAVIYRCITGTIPESSLQRTILDELPSPTAIGFKIPIAFENILMKGLQVEKESRWQNMDDLYNEISAQLPVSKTPSKFFYSFLGIASFTFILLLIYCVSHFPELKVRLAMTQGDATTFRVSAPSTMTSKEFTSAIEIIEVRAESLAGKRNYLIDKAPSDVILTIPNKYLPETEDWNRTDILRFLFSYSGKWLLHKLDMTQYFTLSSDDVNMVTLKYGYLPVKTQSGDSNFYNGPIDWASEKESYYLEFDLGEEASKFLGNALKDSGYNFLVSAHYEKEVCTTSYFFDWIAKGDGKTIYFPLGQVGTKDFAETFALLFSKKGYAQSLAFTKNCSTHLKNKERENKPTFSEATADLAR